ELLHELAPAATTIGALVNPKNPAYETEMGEARIATNNLGMHLLILNASSHSEIETAFSKLVGERVGALLVTGETFFAGADARDQIIALAAHHEVPAVYLYPPFARAGGLMGYGTNFADAFRLAGVYAGRILKGENPADLPVQEATKIELYIN